LARLKSGSIAAMKETDTMSNRAGAGGEQSEAADQRRAQILQAAIDVISERGYADTRIADVGSGFGEADRVRGDWRSDLYAPIGARSASHQASSSAQPTKASTALCQDNGALQTPLTNLDDASGGKGTLTQMTADLKDAQAKLSAFAGDAHGAFSIQTNALKSALTTLQTAVRGGSSGSNSPAKISTALDGVTTADSDLLRVLAQGGCVGGGWWNGRSGRIDRSR
jgi:uncharacterized protein YukE